MRFKRFCSMAAITAVAVGVLFGIANACGLVVIQYATCWYSAFPAGGLLKSKYEIVKVTNTCSAAYGTQWMTRYAISNYATTSTAKEVYIMHKVDADDPSTWKYLCFTGGNLDGGKFNSTPKPAWSGTMAANSTRYFYLYPVATFGWLPWQTSVLPDQVCFIFDNTIDNQLSLDYITVSTIR